MAPHQHRVLAGCLLRRLLLPWLTAAGLGLTFAAVADDGPSTPPQNPGPGYVGILPNPPLPPGYIVDQGTSPWGVSSMFNAPALVMGQSFRPTRASMEWVGLVYQNTVQPTWPEVPGDGQVRISIYTDLALNSGALSGLLGVSETVDIELGDPRWVLFQFPSPVALTPGALHYMHVEHVGGYPATFVGGRLDNVYAGGSAFGYLYNQFTGSYQRQVAFGGYDLVFAQGVQAIPEPAIGWLMLSGIALVVPLAARRSARRRGAKQRLLRIVHAP